MQESWQGFVWILDWIARGTGLVAVLGGALGFYYKEKLKQILAKSLGEDLENLKAQLARELEAYKVSLIAETERTKARQDVRKSIGLKAAERRFEKVYAVVQAIVHTDLTLLAYCTGTFANDTLFTENREQALGRLTRMSDAYYDSVLYLDNALRLDYVAMHKQFLEIFGHRTSLARGEAMASNDARVVRTLELSLAVENRLRVMLNEMEAA